MLKFLFSVRFLFSELLLGSVSTENQNSKISLNHERVCFFLVNLSLNLSLLFISVSPKAAYLFLR